MIGRTISHYRIVEKIGGGGMDVDFGLAKVTQVGSGTAP
jgi:hypothetical protein